jgi:hypothetical protein
MHKLITAALAAPIADPGTPSLPAFSGSPFGGAKISDPTLSPQNPYMAANPNSNIHNDAWMTDAYQRRGPLGNSPVAFSGALPPSLCGSLTFDSEGRIVTVCPSLVAPPTARIIDPETLEVIGDFVFPDAPDPPGTLDYQNFAGGGYFYLDNKDRLIAATKTDHVYVLGQTADGTDFELLRDYDLTSVLDTATERISSTLPDFDGRIWFVTKANGKVGTIDRKTGALKVTELGEQIQNSFAVDERGVYIVTEKRMYRFRANSNDKPKVIWRKTYENSGVVKPGQADAGSGTTPTLMDNGYVAITDNAEPQVNVVVYRRAAKLHGAKRVVCSQPVFEPGASATENSLITAGRSLLVENNYGYQDPFGPRSGAVTEPGFARVDVKKNGKDCKLRWTNTEVYGATVVPKLSTKTGLVYTYTRPPDPAAQGYYWTTIDWRNGATAFSQYAGSGLGFNNNYAGLALGPDRTAYLGVTGGIVALRDGG